MSGVQYKTEIVGIRDTVQLLKKTEPEIFKEFRSKAKFAVDPIVKDAQMRINRVSARNGKSAPLSGMLKPWAPKGRQVFPWNQQKAVKGVKVKLLTTKQSFLTVTQMDVAGAVFDIAGRKNSNALSRSLDMSLEPSRTMWPAAESKEDEVTKNLAELVNYVNEKTNKKLRF
jgi:hypothetical protein